MLGRSPESPLSVAGTKFQVGCAVWGPPGFGAQGVFAGGQISPASFPSARCDPLSWLGVGTALFEERLVTEARFPCGKMALHAVGSAECRCRASSAGCLISCVWAHSEPRERMCSWMAVTV